MKLISLSTFQKFFGYYTSTGKMFRPIFIKGAVVKYTHYNYVVGFLSLSMFAHLAAVDYAVVATINTGVNPSSIAISKNGHKGYVTNYNNYGIDGQDSVSVLDLKHNKPYAIINDASFDGPYTVTLNHKNTRAYVTNSNSTTISIIDIKNNKNSVIGVIDGFNGPSGMVIGKDNIAYVVNYGAGAESGMGDTVSVVNLKTMMIIETITVAQAPAALAISHDGKFVYVVSYVDGNPGTGVMSTISTHTNTVVNTLDGFFGPFDIAVNKDGKYAYVTNFGSNNFAPFGTTVSFVRLKCTPYIKNTVTVGIQPAGIAIKPDQHFAFVTNYNELYDGDQLMPGQGTVNVIDLHHLREVVSPTIAVGQGPDAIATSPNGRTIYVANFTSNTVTVIQKVEDEDDSDDEDAPNQQQN
jgi:DNA-binding beta-propeller fold protein YncE